LSYLRYGVLKLNVETGTSGHIMLWLSCALPQEVDLDHLMSTMSGRFYFDHQFEFVLLA
jgi:hypothetical protein